MKDRINGTEISKVFKQASSAGLINREDTSLLFYNLTFISERFSEVKKLFPPSTLHTAAIKANPIVGILNLIKDYGAGLEAASLPEVYLAKSTGYPGDKVVFDSPAKTEEEIKYALNFGAHINADSLEELEIIDKIISNTKTKSTIGLRVNPQVGTGKIAITSVAGEYSKFGVPLKEFKLEIIKAYLKYNWLSGIHLHVGSQGCPPDLLLNGAGVVYELALEINRLLVSNNKQRLINIFDLGGGYPVSYSNDEAAPSMAQYAKAIKEKFPLLFSERFKLITEFGRYYFANTAFAISRVDNIKKQSGITTIVSHLGADFLLRRVYNPGFWNHDISVLDKNGNVKTGISEAKYIIGGPLCFAGDIVAREIELPAVEKGDHLVIHDVGAYTFSMWSRYNSRQMPKVLGYNENDEKFILLKERESLSKVFQFWE